MNLLYIDQYNYTSGRYDDFAQYLVENQFNVYCLDPYGQGLNVLPDHVNLGIWPKSGFRKQVQAVDKIVKEIKNKSRF